MNEREKTYIFWVGNMRYIGKIVDDNETHWVVDDRKIGKVDIPKTAVRQEYRGGA